MAPPGVSPFWGCRLLLPAVLEGHVLPGPDPGGVHLLPRDAQVPAGADPAEPDPGGEGRALEIQPCVTRAVQPEPEGSPQHQDRDRSEQRERARDDHRAHHDAHGVHGNARVDAMNTRIRLITRRAFGFHSADALVALALLSFGGLCPPLPGRQLS
jgi:hypothetical protein